ncbi:PREDICTED: TELO2-interacting protein 1 homolog [Dinoponera quadriceps]|uniref:TELO2-interacting protein 1 homolog n=1 Tax=Dinoponera quadriceps TaxID=609295 RepID=A0A6P3WSQ1_DINQU|nr:PREDICTED: TELO2-interacting protein 1 homolog [Dinoponera quadriceps]XP_014469145.1 PREDICTED: TELO2-interacting protein 1 homolog [Dinoponera quadriceps]
MMNTKMDASTAQVFLELKSCCDHLMRDPKKDNIYKFVEIITNNGNIAMQYLLEYCLRSTIISLQVVDLSKDKKEELLRILRLVLQNNKIKKLTDFIRIYSTVLVQIYDKSQINKVITFHEELKELVVLCIKDIIHQSFIEVIELLYNKENRVTLGQGILLCLTIAKTEKSPIVRLAAIDAIMALCYVHDEVDRSDIVLQEQVADTVMIFLPGIIGGLQEIIIEGEIQNHKVAMMAVRAWGRIISLIMHDKEETVLSVETLMKADTCYNTCLLNTSARTKTFDKENYLKQDVRNQHWFEAAASKLGSSVQLLEKVRSHSHYKVRLELVESINLVLQNCFRNMKPNIMALIDHLISLSEDEIVDVGAKAQSVLTIISENFMRRHNMNLTNLLEEKFYSLLTRLPTIVRWSNDDEQLASLNQFAGYLKLLGEQNLPHTMSSQVHTRKLLLALVYIMEIDCNAISLLQTTNVRDLDDPAYFYGSDSWKQFKFIKNSLCKQKIVGICKLLGYLGDLNILVDAILELMSDVPLYRKELSLLLNWIVPVQNSSASHLYKEIVHFYTSEEVWYLPIEVTEATSLMQAQSNIVQCCLLMEGLGCIAKNLKRDYDIHLLKTLYLIMERAGNGNSLISYIGVRTLEIIAKAQQHNTIGDLLCANVDYFSFHIIMKLRQVDLNTGVLDVVEVVMKYSELNFLPYLRGIVENALGQLSNSSHQKNTYGFLRVFYAFITCMQTLLKCEDTQITKEDVQITSNFSEMIIHSLLEYYKAKQIDKKLKDDERTEETELDSDLPNIESSEEANGRYTNSYAEDKQEDKELPLHVQIVVKIMKCCLNFLPSYDVQTSLMAMQTLQAGLMILAEWENELLPIVHQMWHPLIDRFNNKNVIVITRAWQLLYVLASVSNDFIRSRTLRDVLPPVSKFLIESSKESIDKGSKNIYKFTQTYKLQYELLHTLGVVARLLKLREQELWRILSDTQFYLSARQNPALQACCVQLYKEIADYNGDVVWVKCLGIWNSNVEKIVSDVTFDIKDILNPKNVATSNEYYKNVQEIIIYIQGKTFSIC